LAIDLKREFPDLMMICDNSHICGRRDLLQAVAQEAMDLNYDGIMTEVHPRPDEAWSDAAQQITPAVFKTLVDSLIIRQETTDDQNFLTHIDDLRQKIDELDDELLKLLGKRMSVAEQIGEYKKRNNISILQTSRWNDILDQTTAKAQKQGLSEAFINTYLRAIHQESIDRQEQVMNSGEQG
jgi:chorismate mutase